MCVGLADASVGFELEFPTRNIGNVTPKITYFHYLKKSFLDLRIQKNAVFYFESKSAGLKMKFFYVSTTQTNVDSIKESRKDFIYSQQDNH